MLHVPEGGFITVFTGPMFCGKTTQLLLSANTHTRCGKNTIIIVPDNSIRDQDISVNNQKKLVLCSRDGVVSQCDTVLVGPHNLQEYCKNIAHDVICIDEGQFFSHLIVTCRYLRALGKIVYVSGLELTFRRDFFGEMALLSSFADRKLSFNAVCNDCKSIYATLTFRISNSTELLDVGGSEKYIPLCQLCYDARPVPNQ